MERSSGLSGDKAMRTAASDALSPRKRIINIAATCFPEQQPLRAPATLERWRLHLFIFRNPIAWLKELLSAVQRCVSHRIMYVTFGGCRLLFYRDNLLPLKCGYWVVIEIKPILSWLHRRGKDVLDERIFQELLCLVFFLSIYMILEIRRKFSQHSKI